MPEVESLGKSHARQAYEFEAKVSLAITAKQRPVIEARSFRDTPYIGHTLAEPLEQA